MSLYDKKYDDMLRKLEYRIGIYKSRRDECYRIKDLTSYIKYDGMVEAYIDAYTMVEYDMRGQERE